MNWQRLRESVKDHEGKRLKPYRCTAGKTTIGYGRNLDDNGITDHEAEAMLDADLLRALQGALDAVPTFAVLSDARQEVLVEMAFNLGARGLAGFKKTLGFIAAEAWEDAAAEMMDSRWAEQVGQRAVRLSRKFANG